MTIIPTGRRIHACGVGDVMEGRISSAKAANAGRNLAILAFLVQWIVETKEAYDEREHFSNGRLLRVLDERLT